jgi:hypothetical protein
VRVYEGKTDYVVTTKSEGASAEDRKLHFQGNRLSGTTIEIIKLGVLLCPMYLVLESILLMLTEGCR